MLVRRSRTASYLTKQSGMLASLGKGVQKKPALALGIVGGAAAGGAAAGEDIRRGMVGLSPEYLAARRMGYDVPKIQTSYRNPITVANNVRRSML